MSQILYISIFEYIVKGNTVEKNTNAHGRGNISSLFLFVCFYVLFCHIKMYGNLYNWSIKSFLLKEESEREQTNNTSKVPCQVVFMISQDK